MSIKERFAKNTFSLMGSQLVIKALSFVLGIFLARYLGAKDYGKYSFGYAYLALFTPLAGLGLNLVVAREGARKREEVPALVGTSMVIKLISTSAMVFLAYIILQFIPTSQDAKVVVYFFGIGFILEHIYGSVHMSYSAYERFDIFALVQFIERVISFGLIFTILLIGYRLIAVSIIRPITAVVILVISIWIAYQSILRSRLYFNHKLLPFFLKEGWPFMADSLFMIMYLNIDRVMLQALKDSVSVGLYSVASGLILVFMPLQMAALQSVYPIFSRTFTNEKATFSLYYERISRFLISMGVCIALIITFVASPLVSILYGKDYLQSVLMLQIVIWALPLMALSSLARTALMSCNLQRIPMWIGACNVILNIVLNSILIPILGGHGAAIATIFTQFVGLIVFVVCIRKKMEYVKVINGMRFLMKSDFSVIKGLVMKGITGRNKTNNLQ